MKYNLPAGYLSPTAINRYISCPECFRLKYVDRIPAPVSINLPVGGAVHRAVEGMRHWMLSIHYDMDREVEFRDQDSAPFLLSATQIALDDFDAEVQKVQGDEIGLDLGKYSDIDAARKHAKSLIDFVMPRMVQLDTDRGLIGAEVMVCSSPDLLSDEERKLSAVPEDVVQEAFPFPFKGRIDGVYGVDTVTGIQDLKTKSKRDVPDLATAIQMALYQRPFGDSVQVFVDVAYKTKQPGMSSYEFNSADHAGDDLIWRLVMDAAEKISEGYFPPRPSFLCDYDHGFPGFSIVVPEAMAEVAES